MAHRIVGWQVRALTPTDEEARPDKVAILYPGNPDPTVIEIKDQQSEIDFIQSRLVTAWREPKDGEDLTQIFPHHITWRKLKKDESPDDFPENLVRQFNVGKKSEHYAVATRVPDTYTGLRTGDRVAMVLGTGDLLARDISEYGEDMNIKVVRLRGFTLKEEREKRDLKKDTDATLLARLYRKMPMEFYEIRPEDKKLVELSGVWRQRVEAQRQRIRVGNRLRGRARWTTLSAKRAPSAVDSVEQAFAAAKASDKQFKLIEAEERRVEKELATLLEGTIIGPIVSAVVGMGPVTAARILATVGDIRRFYVTPSQEQMAKLREERNTWLELGEFTRGRKLLGITPSRAGYASELSRVRDYWREQGEADKAEAMTEAMKTVKKLGRLKRNAYKRSENRFIAYSGLHVLPDGTFPRRRRGVTCNWHPELRQAFFLLVDMQFKFRATSEWGLKLRANRDQYREQRPHIVQVGEGLTPFFRRLDRLFLRYGVSITQDKMKIASKDDLLALMEKHEALLFNPSGQTAVTEEDREKFAALRAEIAALKPKPKRKLKKIYSNGHIMKMAVWKTACQFARWLFRQWWNQEQNRAWQRRFGSASEDTEASKLDAIVPVPITTGGPAVPRDA